MEQLEENSTGQESSRPVPFRVSCREAGVVPSGGTPRGTRRHSLDKGRRAWRVRIGDGDGTPLECPAPLQGGVKHADHPIRRRGGRWPGDAGERRGAGAGAQSHPHRRAARSQRQVRRLRRAGPARRRDGGRGVRRLGRRPQDRRPDPRHPEHQPGHGVGDDRPARKGKGRLRRRPDHVGPRRRRRAGVAAAEGAVDRARFVGAELRGGDRQRAAGLPHLSVGVPLSRRHGQGDRRRDRQGQEGRDRLLGRQLRPLAAPAGEGSLHRGRLRDRRDANWCARTPPT